MTLDDWITGHQGEDQFTNTFDGLTQCPVCGEELQQVDQQKDDSWTGACWPCQEIWHWDDQGYWKDDERAKPPEPHTISEEGPTDENDPAFRFHDEPTCPSCGGPADEREAGEPCHECKVEDAERIAEGDR
jgi:hypothetical protein